MSRRRVTDSPAVTVDSFYKTISKPSEQNWTLQLTTIIKIIFQRRSEAQNKSNKTVKNGLKPIHHHTYITSRLDSYPSSKLSHIQNLSSQKEEKPGKTAIHTINDSARRRIRQNTRKPETS